MFACAQFAIGSCLSLLFWATGVVKMPKWEWSLVGAPVGNSLLDLSMGTLFGIWLGYGVY